ncbi:MAG: multifunctional transcriptional regulator/nicotinamide-nucleotide adenylyltransferase/ribosylnicotinamide kinase NadR [Flammeovirgaceae bacterium]|nr:multifunctional transcriptional regulator/nicotinamide-nucleotide adenylyltransferase/ribosylnicotinamide kinase NadR [Flammeovirgaceae bacterium]
MKRGLVIGKFMPLHYGHISLIEFAAAHCDELIVSMSYNAFDVISDELRFSWIIETFKDQPNIKVFSIVDDFDREDLSLNERTKIWADRMRQVYPPIDIIFSSEEYGIPFAKNLRAEHKSFDPERKLFPVSATRIRKKPFAYWKFIPKAVRPFFVKKICFYGPESTGKTFLAQKLATYYHTEFVPEVAREVVTSNDFTLEDIIKIGYMHVDRIKEKTRTANKILFCDTDAITTQIYCRHYLGSVPQVLFELEKEIIYDQYFLFDIDVPWVNDGMRDLGERRKELFDIFKRELETRNLPYLLVKGDYEERARFVTMEVEKMLSH